MYIPGTVVSTLLSFFRVEVLVGAFVTTAPVISTIKRFAKNFLYYAWFAFICGVILLLLVFNKKYTIMNANLKLINAKIHSFYSIDVH